MWRNANADEDTAGKEMMLLAIGNSGRTSGMCRDQFDGLLFTLHGVTVARQPLGLTAPQFCARARNPASRLAARFNPGFSAQHVQIQNNYRVFRIAYFCNFGSVQGGFSVECRLRGCQTSQVDWGQRRRS